MNYEYHPKDKKYLDDNGLSHFQYYTSKIADAHRIGAVCWVDAVIKSYRKTKSMRLSAIELNVSQRCIDNTLRALKYPKNKQGGPNHTGAEKVEGATCKRYHTTQKYKSTNQCVECMRRYNAKKNIRKSDG